MIGLRGRGIFEAERGVAGAAERRARAGVRAGVAGGGRNAEEREAERDWVKDGCGGRGAEVEGRGRREGAEAEARSKGVLAADSGSDCVCRR